DDEITEAFKILPAKEGVFAEPGSCASIAGVFQQVKAGTIPQGSKVVAVLTGNGLKDPQTAVDQIDVEITSLPYDEEAVTNYIKNKVLRLFMFVIRVTDNSANVGQGFDS